MTRSQIEEYIVGLVDAVRRRADPFYRAKLRAENEALRLANAPYEYGDKSGTQPRILSTEQTLEMILAQCCSVSRYGDGEFRIAQEDNFELGFQPMNAELSCRLREVLTKPCESLLVCLPNIFGSLERFVPRAQHFWRRELSVRREALLCLLSDMHNVFGDAFISRPYIDTQDDAYAERCFNLWKQIFAGRDILVVEGRYSRFGIGNDLLAPAATVRRIWCPPEDAFSQYDAIMAKVRRFVQKTDLILLALGPTATVLAYDLACEGYQAIDIGHLDLEYIWWRMGAKKKVAIKGRYVNECWFGQEMKPLLGEAEANNVISDIS